jgi:hypothetical protein
MILKLRPGHRPDPTQQLILQRRDMVRLFEWIQFVSG